MIRYFKKTLTLLLLVSFSGLHAQKYLKKFNSIAEITPVGSKVFFNGNNGFPHNSALWVTDGTSEGTQLVKSLEMEDYSFNPQNLIQYKDQLYFSAFSPYHGTELWKSDGTPDGTVLLKDINPNTNDYYNGSNPGSFLIFKNKLYFVATDNGYDYSLYKSDGTSGGTTSFYFVDKRTTELVVAGDYLYFNTGYSTFRTDGTLAGTHPVLSDGSYSRGDHLTAVGYQLFYITHSSNYDNIKLYTLSSADLQPELLAEFDAPLYGRHEIDNFCAVGDKLFFSFRTYYESQEPTDELWVSDGTTEGTAMIKSFQWQPHWSDSEMSDFTAFNNELFFKSSESAKRALWKSDGTAEGTEWVNDVVITAPTYEKNPPVISNGKLFFSGNRELWSSDGTPGGTAIFADINQNGESLPRELADANDILYFAADDGSGLALWNNAPAPEILVKSGYGSISSGGLIRFNKILAHDCIKKTITISNIGNKELILSEVSVTEKDFFIRGEVPEIILPKEEISFDLFFVPLMPGERKGTLMIVNNDPNENRYSITLTGETLENENQGFCDSFDDETLVKKIKATAPVKKIAISNSQIKENLPAGTVVGTFSLPDNAETVAYSLVAGVGDEGNHNFVIEGDKLKTKVSFDSDDNTFFAIRVRASGSVDVEDLIQITVVDNSAKAAEGKDCENVVERLSKNYNDLAFNTDGYLFVVGQEGAILRSQDQGVSWEEMNSGVGGNLHVIIFRNSVGYITGTNVLLKSEDNGKTWSQLYLPVSSSYYPLTMHFIDENEGYVSGTDGALLYTNNGGRSWEERKGLNQDFRDFWFWDEKNGIALTDYWEMAKTTDGGITWTEVDTENLGYYKNFKKLWFIDKKKGFALSNSQLYTTTDGGERWIKSNSISGSYFTKIKFTDDKNGYISGGWSGSELYVTEDGGTTWSVKNAYPAYAISGLDVNPTDQRLFVAGNRSGLGSAYEPGHTFMSSADKGTSWNILSQLGANVFRKINVADENTAYVLEQHYAFKTADQGRTWEEINFGKPIFDIYFFDEQNGFLTGIDTIYRTSDGGKTLDPLFYTNPYEGESGATGIYVINSTLSFYFGSSALYRTENSGGDWELVYNGSSIIKEIYFPTENTGYLIELFGDVYKSTDGGKTWAHVRIREESSSKVYSAIYFSDELSGIIGGEKGELYTTKDGGATWDPVLTGINADFKKFLFIDGREGYAMTSSGSGSTLYKTVDGGNNWKKTASIYNNLHDIGLQGNNLYLTGEYGYLAKTKANTTLTRPGYLVGDAVVCKGAVATYKVADDPAREYQWSIDGAELLSSRAEASVHFPEPGSYTLQLRHISACGTSESRALPISVVELETPAIEGPERVGLGEENVLYTLQHPVAGDVELKWNVDHASAFVENGTSVEVDWYTTKGSGKVSVIATDARSGCRVKGLLEVLVGSAVLAIEDTDPFDMVIYPNPTPDQIQILSNISSDLYVSIYDENGRKVLHKEVLPHKSEAINLQRFPAGFYFVEVRDPQANKQVTRKIIKL